MSVNRVSLKASEVPVKSVAIFQSSTAEVTRLLTVELKSGTNIIEIAGISDSADPSSPRIYGPPDASVRVLDTVCRRPAPDARPLPSAEVTALLAQSHALQSRWIVCQEEMGLLDSAARLATTPGSGVATDHAGLLAFVETFAQKKLAAHVEVRALDAQIAAVEEELRVVRGARRGEARTVVTASVFVEKEGVVDLRLTYLVVSGVRWTPCYDLHIPMTDGQPSTDVSLRCGATVSQGTGEDWMNTALTLSMATVHAQKQLSVPSITPLRIKLGAPPTAPRRRPPPPPPPPPSHPGNPREPPPPPPPPCGRNCNVPIASHPPPMAAVPAPAPPPAPILVQQAPTPTTADVSDWSDSESESDPVLVEPLVPQSSAQAAPTRTAFKSDAYTVPGVLLLPSDGQEHRVTFATLNLKAVLRHECVPRKSEAVFVVATVENTSARPLLAGPMSVFVDESFVSQTALKFIAVKESFRCVLGMDTALKVTYRQHSTTENQPQVSMLPRKVVARSTTTTVANQHTHAVAGLVVRDAIPLRNEAGKVAVTLRKPAGLAQAAVCEDVAVKLGEEQEDVAVKARWVKGGDGKSGDKDGLYEWECAVPPGKTVTLETQWDVSAENDEEWYEGP